MNNDVEHFLVMFINHLYILILKCLTFIPFSFVLLGYLVFKKLILGVLKYRHSVYESFSGYIYDK